MRSSLLGVAVGLVVLGTTAAAHADDWEHTYTVGRATPLRLKTGDAQVRLHAGPANTVRMRVHTHNLTIGKRLLIGVSEDGGVWSAEVRERPQVWGFHIDIGPRVVVDLDVPQNCDLTVSTGDGAVEADDIGGRLDLHTGDGSIRADHLRGTVRLDTGDGGVDVHGLDGQLVARSGDGHLRLDGRFDRLEVTSGDGPVQVDVGAGSRVGDGWSIETGDGGVRLRLPNDLRGALHGGGGPLEIHSGDGSIHILAL